MEANLVYNLGINGLSILLLVTLFCFIRQDGEEREFYYALKRLLIATLVCIVFLVPSHFYAGHPEWNSFQLAFTLLSTVFSVLIFVFFAEFLFEMIELEYSERPPFSEFVPLFSGLYVLSALFPFLLGDVYCDEEGYLATKFGIGLVLLFVVTLILFLSLFIILIRYRRAFRNWEIVLLSLYFLVPLYLNLRLDWSDSPIYAFYVLEELYLFLMICSKRNWEFIRSERELAEKNYVLSELRGRTLISQIQPAFLESSLLAIADLCEEKPWEAREVTVDFADFLRGNLQAVRGSAPVFFSWELEHIDLYLSVERVRLGSHAQVSYNLGPTNFLLPPLSVQPLVEYAIQQGGKVTLSTEKKKEGWFITVLSEKAETGQTTDWDRFDGIPVIRDRLREQVKGTLRLFDRPGKWSRVMLTIPDGIGEVE